MVRHHKRKARSEKNGIGATSAMATIPLKMVNHRDLEPSARSAQRASDPMTVETSPQLCRKASDPPRPAWPRNTSGVKTDPPPVGWSQLLAWWFSLWAWAVGRSRQ